MTHEESEEGFPAVFFRAGLHADHARGAVGMYRAILGMDYVLDPRETGQRLEVSQTPENLRERPLGFVVAFRIPEGAVLLALRKELVQLLFNLVQFH